MLRLSAVVLLLCFITAGLHAGDPLFVPYGADKTGMAFASVASPDHWASFHNQALMTGCTGFSAGLSLESKFMVAEMSSNAISVIVPGGPTPLGFIASHFGNRQYSLFFTGIGSAVRLTDDISLGIQADYIYQNGIDAYKDVSHITFETGLFIRINSQLCAGLHTVNPITTLNSLSSSLRSGISWTPSADFLLSVEASKVSHEPLSVHGGLSWIMKEKLALRAGYMSSPSSVAFGVGFISGSVRTDLGFLFNNLTGVTSSVSITFSAH